MSINFTVDMENQTCRALAVRSLVCSIFFSSPFLKVTFATLEFTMVQYNFKKITVVPPAKDFVDIVLSKTQRKTPTGNYFYSIRFCCFLRDSVEF